MNDGIQSDQAAASGRLDHGGRMQGFCSAKRCGAKTCIVAVEEGEMAGLSRFERPVVVQLGRHGADRIVLDVNDAATILLRNVPHQTEKRRRAMDACLQVLRGQAHPPAARRAFVAAALEAKILRSD
ncbi:MULTISPECIES: DUF982 domain-containing protein [unclassified Mesorhizobium]|uniref:DUF982 domain-containing protein n=1 Tax=unclassified Mesorhizobium TaxID=325217 RepID=UPI001FE02624|nr:MULTISPECIES: DUF982 domain-containing protein [unclassified Mesorhizobium]